ncbi:hypothetical protein Bbelb_161320 [Branchiostoma belcheri]|nr:hypothetical protein Bbelb_161320 [Branchiostoma belcheri]
MALSNLKKKREVRKRYDFPPNICLAIRCPAAREQVDPRSARREKSPPNNKEDGGGGEKKTSWGGIVGGVSARIRPWAWRAGPGCFGGCFAVQRYDACAKCASGEGHVCLGMQAETYFRWARSHTGRGRDGNNSYRGGSDGRLVLDGAPVETSCSLVNHQADVSLKPGHTGGTNVFMDDLAEKGEIYVRCGQVVSCLQVPSPDFTTVLKHKSRTLMAAVDSSQDAPLFPIILVGVVSGVVILLAMLLLCAACAQKQMSEEAVPTAVDSGVTITRSRSLNMDSRNIVSADQGSRLAAHDRPESGELLGVGMATKENGAVRLSAGEGDPEWHRKSMSSRKLPDLPSPPPGAGGGSGTEKKSSEQGKASDDSEPLQESQYESASSRGAEGPYESIPDRNFPSQDDLYEAVKDQDSGGRRREAGYARMKDVEQQGLAGPETSEPKVL